MKTRGLPPSGVTRKQLREAYYEFTGKLSAVVQSLAFAGIAVVWVLRADTAAAAIPKPLLWPLALFAASLGCHLLHYLAATLTWGYLHRAKEKDPTVTEESAIPVSHLANWPGNTFFALKLLLIIAGYGTLISYAVSVLFGGVAK
jgi:hypothetical protein